MHTRISFTYLGMGVWSCETARSFVYSQGNAWSWAIIMSDPLHVFLSHSIVERREPEHNPPAKVDFA
jgi:hypothetical protein